MESREYFRPDGLIKMIIINYKYDLSDVEKNHEEHVKNKTVFLSTDAKKLLPKLNNMND